MLKLKAQQRYNFIVQPQTLLFDCCFAVKTVSGCICRHQVTSKKDLALSKTLFLLLNHDVSKTAAQQKVNDLELRLGLHCSFGICFLNQTITWANELRMSNNEKRSCFMKSIGGSVGLPCTVCGIIKVRQTINIKKKVARNSAPTALQTSTFESSLFVRLSAHA